MNLNDQLESLRPTRKERLIDLVERCGIDVTPWGNNYLGKHPSQNPAFCYEWAFKSTDLILINIWRENLKIENSNIFQVLNLRQFIEEESEPRKGRNKRFDEYIREAYEKNLSVRAIILDRNSRETVGKRMLDSEIWRVAFYEYASGEFKIERTTAREQSDIENPENEDEELNSFPEGSLREQFIKHRKREARLRSAKIKRFAQTHAGRVFCEVKNCKIDFNEKYGPIGQGFAHVHHLTPLKEAPDEGRQTNLDDLAVVCPNCHAMIHRGGDNRTLDEIDVLLATQQAKLKTL
jgi:5-methylcytosine-specific restriction enzyme A